MQLPDGKPGHYYVTARDERGRYAFLLGPYTETGRPDHAPRAHQQALGLVTYARVMADQCYSWHSTAGASYGTCRLPLSDSPPRGKLHALRF